MKKMIPVPQFGILDGDFVAGKLGVVEGQAVRSRCGDYADMLRKNEPCRSPMQPYSIKPLPRNIQKWSDVEPCENCRDAQIPTNN